MPLSWLHWSLAILLMNLHAPTAFAEEQLRRSAPRQSSKRPTVKKKPAPKRLVRISGGALLRHDAAESFERMYAEARAEGLRLWVISGHRSWEQQRYLYRLYRKGRGPRAARPGRSNHERGTAVDISVGDVTTLKYEWLASNACRFGFKRTVRSEPWHWEYRPRSTRPPRPGHDCQGRPLPPAEVLPELAAPGPS